jgi:hypothetical protein
MRIFSKSKIIAFRQCPRRLWLEIHKPELRRDSSSAQARFKAGDRVGEIARNLYDPRGQGTFIDIGELGISRSLAKTRGLLEQNKPVFEAGFSAGGGLVFADALLPVRRKGARAWRMVEVKSAASVKGYHRDDAAIQAFVARQAGVSLASIAVAHVDTSWVYPGMQDYQGLLREEDLTQEAFGRSGEVREWISEAQVVAAKTRMPKACTGTQCSTPFECGFSAYCSSLEPQAELSANVLPRVQTKALRALFAEQRTLELADVADDLLNERQLRVKTHTLAGTVFFDGDKSALALSRYPLPAYFVDFETAQLAVPLWSGFKPYQQVPFQFSVHKLDRRGDLSHREFLDLSGDDPTRGFAEALVKDCGKRGPVYVYNAAFERSRVRELAERYPDLANDLLAINERMVDLLRITETYYYHPDQLGSWSIKKVLPTVAPELRYDDLDGIQDGGMAMDAYQEAVDPETPHDRKVQLRAQLRKYCALDTFAMVRLWQFFAGRNDLELPLP